MRPVLVVWWWVRRRLVPERPPLIPAVAAAVLGSGAAVVGGLAAPQRVRLDLILALCGFALVAAATRWIWVSALLTLGVVLGLAVASNEPSSALVVALAVLLTGFVLAAHWPGVAALRGWTPLAMLVAIPAAALLAAAADLASRGTGLFVGGLILVGAALGVAFAPVLAVRGTPDRR